MRLEPTCKDYWKIPGGYVETGESPSQACIREVREELGIESEIGRLLAVSSEVGSYDFHPRFRLGGPHDPSAGATNRGSRPGQDRRKRGLPIWSTPARRPYVRHQRRTCDSGGVWGPRCR